jgi:hypothetical protein
VEEELMADDTIDSRIKKLPMWAQKEFARLLRINTLLLAERAELTAGPEESDTIADPKIDMLQDGRTPRPLGNGAEVEFHLSPERENKVSVKLIDHKGRRVLQVCGDYALNIEVRGSNILHVANIDRSTRKFRED